MNTNDQSPSPVQGRDANGELILDPQAQAKSRKRLIIIFALFFVPLLLATVWMQMVKAGGGAWGNTSNGELINPAVPLTDFTLIERGQDAPFELDEVRGQWTILYVPSVDGANVCDAACQETLIQIRQARLALNHRMERVQRVLLLDQTNVLSAEVLAEQVGVRIVGGDENSVAQLVDQITAAQSGMDAKQNLIFLIDPLGNLMMRYTSDQLPKPLYKDLKHLLKVSRIG
jgi:cytochrome oxidase Cu insertion factor (SCO1/SenC/PrrC family)